MATLGIYACDENVNTPSIFNMLSPVTTTQALVRFETTRCLCWLIMDSLSILQ